MTKPEPFLLEFIGENADILAKMARIDGLDALAFILQMAKVEANRVKQDLHGSEADEHARAD